MNIIRTDQQTALHDLLIAVEESADHYQNAAEYVADHSGSVYFQQFAKQRLILASRLQEAIRNEGELPPVPDPDKESGAMLFQRLVASLSQEETHTIIEQRLDKEQALNELLQQAQELGVGDTYPELQQDLIENNRMITQTLQDLEQLDS